MKLRRAGWQIRFAPQARAFTDVPQTMPALIAQRLRWDRGLITIWLRKFRGELDPRPASFRPVNLFALLDVLLFQIGLAGVLPVYLVWLFYYFGSFAVTVIGATLIGYIAITLLGFTVAAAFNGDSAVAWRLLPYVPLHILVQIGVMRPVRLVALAQEFLFRSSYRDPYVPGRVMRQAERV